MVGEKVAPSRFRCGQAIAVKRGKRDIHGSRDIHGLQLVSHCLGIMDAGEDTNRPRDMESLIELEGVEDMVLTSSAVPKETIPESVPSSSLGLATQQTKTPRLRSWT